jgi:predicted AAA+ superfamily ATPase
VLDEIQYAPHIFSPIKARIDRERRKNGNFILTGSQAFQLMAGVTESLAGRVGLHELLPFSMGELDGESLSPKALNSHIFSGMYPDVVAHGVEPHAFFLSYVRTYVERDVRQIVAVHDVATFSAFLELLASRIGSPLNLSDLGRDCGVSHETARRWVSVLESSRIIYLLRPYFSNVTKRVAKVPKLYFTDTGLAAHLLRYPTAETLSVGPMKGQFFENFVVVELLKRIGDIGSRACLYYRKDSAGKEIDLIVDAGDSLVCAEIKGKKTISADDCSAVTRYEVRGKTVTRCVISLNDDEVPLTRTVRNVPWYRAADLVTKEKT